MNTTLRYKLSSTGDSSAKYGKCECCGAHCSETHIISFQRHFSYHADGETFAGWTHYQAPKTLFGHIECLNNRVKELSQDNTMLTFEGSAHLPELI